MQKLRRFAIESTSLDRAMPLGPLLNWLCGGLIILTIGCRYMIRMSGGGSGGGNSVTIESFDRAWEAWVQEAKCPVLDNQHGGWEAMGGWTFHPFGWRWAAVAGSVPSRVRMTQMARFGSNPSLKEKRVFDRDEDYDERWRDSVRKWNIPPSLAQVEVWKTFQPFTEQSEDIRLWEAWFGDWRKNPVLHRSGLKNLGDSGGDQKRIKMKAADSGMSYVVWTSAVETGVAGGQWCINARYLSAEGKDNESAYIFGIFDPGYYFPQRISDPDLGEIGIRQKLTPGRLDSVGEGRDGLKPLGLAFACLNTVWFTASANEEWRVSQRPRLDALVDQIGRVKKGEKVEWFPLPAPYQHATPTAICKGADGAMWFTLRRGNAIGRIDGEGHMSFFPLPTRDADPLGIVLGPDGALWFTEFGASQIGHIVPDGSIKEYPTPTPGAWPTAIEVGQDGHLWFYEVWGMKVGRITLQGRIDEMPLPKEVTRLLKFGPTFSPHGKGLVRGPGREMWLTETGLWVFNVDEADRLIESGFFRGATGRSFP